MKKIYILSMLLLGMTSINCMDWVKHNIERIVYMHLPEWLTEVDLPETIDVTKPKELSIVVWSDFKIPQYMYAKDRLYKLSEFSELHLELRAADAQVDFAQVCEQIKDLKNISSITFCDFNTERLEGMPVWGNLRAIALQNVPIRDVSDLKDCLNVTHMVLENNELTSLPQGLDKLSALKTVIVKNNPRCDLMHIGTELDIHKLIIDDSDKPRKIDTSLDLSDHPKTLVIQGKETLEEIIQYNRIPLNIHDCMIKGNIPSITVCKLFSLLLHCKELQYLYLGGLCIEYDELGKAEQTAHLLKSLTDLKVLKALSIGEGCTDFVSIELKDLKKLEWLRINFKATEALSAKIKPIVEFLGTELPYLETLQVNHPSLIKVSQQMKRRLASLEGWIEYAQKKADSLEQKNKQENMES